MINLSDMKNLVKEIEEKLGDIDYIVFYARYRMFNTFEVSREED
jgi:hypothetical protein